jgi:hypothetical protein
MDMEYIVMNLVFYHVHIRVECMLYRHLCTHTNVVYKIIYWSIFVTIYMNLSLFRHVYECVYCIFVSMTICFHIYINI